MVYFSRSTRWFLEKSHPWLFSTGPWGPFTLNESGRKSAKDQRKYEKLMGLQKFFHFMAFLLHLGSVYNICDCECESDLASKWIFNQSCLPFAQRWRTSRKTLALTKLNCGVWNWRDVAKREIYVWMAFYFVTIYLSLYCFFYKSIKLVFFLFFFVSLVSEILTCTACSSLLIKFYRT